MTCSQSPETFTDFASLKSPEFKDGKGEITASSDEKIGVGCLGQRHTHL